MDKIVVNKQAAEEIIHITYLRALDEIKAQAARGQETFRIQFTLPNYGDADGVQKKLELHGIKCQARGFSYVKRNDGRYEFDIVFEIK
jgi:hypothetical protein